MVLNLLTNACKYTDSGEIRVVLSVSNGSSNTRAFFEDKMLLVEVIDTGMLFMLPCAEFLRTW